MTKIIKKIKISIDNFLRKKFKVGFCDICYRKITKNLVPLYGMTEDGTVLPYDYLFICSACEKKLD